MAMIDFMRLIAGMSVRVFERLPEWLSVSVLDLTSWITGFFVIEWLSMWLNERVTASLIDHPNECLLERNNRPVLQSPADPVAARSKA
jgi:hypothetical protein